MRKLYGAMLMAALTAVGYFVFQNYDVDGWKQLRLVTKAKEDNASGGSRTQTEPPPIERNGDTIRIASFNIQVFGRTKADKPQVMEVIARIIQRFDVVAIQEIRSTDQDLLPRLIEQINLNGRRYDYVIGPRIGRSHSKEQYAFVYDASSVEVDRNQMYTLSDPDDVLHREPLVGWFRVRGPAPELEAFTFSLVNVHTDPDEAKQELDMLQQVFDLVRNDGRGEDDVIMLGDFNAGDRELGRLSLRTGVAWAISRVPTNTRGNKQYDNIVFDQRATSEFVGRAGVFDFMREFNLTLPEALEVSDHLPVWAEFTIQEGGVPGKVARREPREIAPR